ncbi:hypothetical protein AKG36_01950 [Trueperella bernardiae]|nr:hypothetical protein AKG36_01950 [Trueperella bernardiae]
MPLYPAHIAGTAVTFPRVRPWGQEGFSHDPLRRLRQDARVCPHRRAGGRDPERGPRHRRHRGGRIGQDSHDVAADRLARGQRERAPGRGAGAHLYHEGGR